MIGVAQLVEAPRYKTEGRGIDSRLGRCHEHYGSNLELGSTQPLTGMTTRDNSWGFRWHVRRGANLTIFMCHCLEILRASTT